jgi:hypothetical protein
MLTRTVTQVYNPATNRWAVALVEPTEPTTPRTREPQPSPAMKAVVSLREARNRTPVARTVQAVALTDREQGMVGKPVSNGQIKAINGYERLLGNVRISPKSVFTDMLDASRNRASLKAECAAKGLL